MFVHPHFLRNSLNCIFSKERERERERGRGEREIEREREREKGGKRNILHNSYRDFSKF